MASLNPSSFPHFLLLLVVALAVPCSGLLCSLEEQQGQCKRIRKKKLSPFCSGIVKEETPGENRAPEMERKSLSVILCL